MQPLQIAVAASCTGQPLKQALTTAAGIGAQGLQFNARTELRPADFSESGRRQFLQLLADLNLKVSSLSLTTRSTFYDLDQLESRIAAAKAALQFTYQLRAQVLTLRVGRIPAEPQSSQYRLLREVLSDIARHGNHVGVATAITPCGDSPETLNQLLEEIGDGPIGVDFDPATVVMSGQSPNQALRSLHESIIHVQARDGLRDVDGSGVEVALGRGEVDWAEFVVLLDEIGYRGWITVNRTQGEDKLGDAARAIEYLNATAGLT